MTGPQRAAPRDREFESHADFYRNSAYNTFPQEHRSAGSMGLGLLSADQDPIDLIDSAVPELVIVLTRTAQSEVAMDAGDGLRVHRNLQAETISVVAPLTEQRFMVKDAHSVTCATLDGNNVKRLLESHGLPPEAWARFVTDMHDRSDIAATLKALWTKSSGSAPQDGLYVDALTLQLLAQICDGPSLSPILDDRADTRIARVIDYIEAHLVEPLSVTELAAIATMSAGHFARCFKATIGEAVWVYVQRRRCERARDLLLHSRETLAQIAYDTGFASQAHMTASLKKRYDATPGEIRRDRA